MTLQKYDPVYYVKKSQSVKEVLVSDMLLGH